MVAGAVHAEQFLRKVFVHRYAGRFRALLKIWAGLFVYICIVSMPKKRRGKDTQSMKNDTIPITTCEAIDVSKSGTLGYKLRMTDFTQETTGIITQQRKPKPSTAVSLEPYVFKSLQGGGESVNTLQTRL